MTTPPILKTSLEVAPPTVAAVERGRAFVRGEEERMTALLAASSGDQDRGLIGRNRRENGRQNKNERKERKGKEE